MTLDELMEKLYEIYEKDTGCDGEVPTNVIGLDFDGERLVIDATQED